MFSLNAARAALRVQSRAFSSTSSRSADMAKLVLIGRLGKEPEVRTTKHNREYVLYSIATNDRPQPTQDGSSPETNTTWHNIFSFNETANSYLRTIRPGSLVYVETNFELRKPDPNAHPDSPEGQRQIFLRHESIKVIRPGRSAEPREESQESQGSHEE